MFFLIVLLGLAHVQAQVLPRIASDDLSFDDQRCVLSSATTPKFACVGVSDSPATCIPLNTNANCAVPGKLRTDPDVPTDTRDFDWFCATANGCGIMNTLGNAAFDLGPLTGLQSAPRGVLGYVDENEPAGIVRQIVNITGGHVVIDQRTEYTFTADVCNNINGATNDVTLTVEVTDSDGAPATPAVSVAASVTLPASGANSDCGQIVLRIPHYVLIGHVGQNGFSVTISKSVPGSAGRVFINEVVLRAEALIEPDNVCISTSNPTTASGDNTTECLSTFINEIFYRSDGTLDGEDPDVTIEGVEIVAPVGTDLTNFEIEVVHFNIDGTSVRDRFPFGELLLNNGSSASIIVNAEPGEDDFGIVVIGLPDGLGDGDTDGGVDGIAIYNSPTSTQPLQFVCYGVNATTTSFSIPNGASCTAVVDLNFENLEQTDVDGVLQLIGCGNCANDFDWVVDAANSIGDLNERQSYCSDGDNDGYWETTCCVDELDAPFVFAVGDGDQASSSGNDCDDTFGHIYPGAEEVCDGEDSNCNPADDVDGNGDPIEQDFDLDGRLGCDGDCDDTDDTIFGEAQFYVDGIVGQVQNCILVANDSDITAAQPELCDDLDNNCNNETNEIFTRILHFRDFDGDGFASLDRANEPDAEFREFPNCQRIDADCEVAFPLGWSPNLTDCDDADPDVHPDRTNSSFYFFEDAEDAETLCNVEDVCEPGDDVEDQVNNNCNFNDVTGEESFDEDEYTDADGDGYSNETFAVASNCGSTRGDLAQEFGNLRVDCNDEPTELGNSINPGVQFETICNRIDENCDGVADDGLFIDLDEDGFGAPPNDEDPSTGSNETCAEFYFINDCNDDPDNGGQEETPGKPNIFCDQFNNTCGFVSCDNETLTCTPAISERDLFDTLPEVCDGVDTDCNCTPDYPGVEPTDCDGDLDGDESVQFIDNGVLFDVDSDDEYNGTEACFSLLNDDGGFLYLRDCNDTDETANQGQEEICNGKDDDCNCIVNNNVQVGCDAIDEGLFVDNDGDTYPGFVNDTCFDFEGIEDFYPNINAIDCEDEIFEINPGATEDFCDNVNSDCALSSIIIDGTVYFEFGPEADQTNNGTNSANGTGPNFIFDDADDDGFRTLTQNGSIVCGENFTSDPDQNGGLFDCDDNLNTTRPCFPNELVCFDIVGIEKPCEERDVQYCPRELEFPGASTFGDGVDNDCDDGIDNLIKTSVRLILKHENPPVQRKRSHDDDDDDSSSSSSSTSSTGDSCPNPVPIIISITNNATEVVTDVVVKGQFNLPPRATLKEYIFGDLETFGVKIDEKTLRVAWVQFELPSFEKREVEFVVCLGRASDEGIQLTLRVENFSLNNTDPLVPKIQTGDFVNQIAVDISTFFASSSSSSSSSTSS